MTTCAECLSTLSTMRLADIRAGSPVQQHYSTCENCSRVVADIQYAENRLALALSELHPSMPSDYVAEDARMRSAKLYRRRVAGWFRAALGVLGLFLLGTYIFENRLTPRAPSVTQTIILKCATSEVASDLVTPYLRSNGSAVYGRSNSPILTLRGTNGEVERAISQIDQYEARFCAVPQPVSANSGPTYSESQVDKPASQIPGTTSPHYPDALRAAGVEGRVKAVFVVNDDGRVEASTFRVLKSTNDAFAKSVRSALPNLRFDAAEIAGKKVRQLVQHDFQFNLDR